MYESEQIKDLICQALEDIQAQDVNVMTVSEISSFTDYMIVATGRSDRHVKACADAVMEKLLEHDIKPIGKEGMDSAQWVLIDFDDAVLHVMRQETREFYDLEGLWGEEVKRLLKKQREGEVG